MSDDHRDVLLKERMPAGAPAGYVDPQVTDGLRALEEAADRVTGLLRRPQRVS